MDGYCSMATLLFLLDTQHSLRGDSKRAEVGCYRGPRLRGLWLKCIRAKLRRAADGSCILDVGWHRQRTSITHISLSFLLFHTNQAQKFDSPALSNMFCSALLRHDHAIWRKR